MVELIRNNNKNEVLERRKDDTESKCCVRHCTINMREILGRFDDGTFSVIMCPNHQIMYVIGILKNSEMNLLPSNLTDKKVCSLCEEQAIIFAENDATYELCSSHLKKLIRKNLLPNEFMVLYGRYGSTFQLHEDFYDNYGGTVQPVKFKEERN
ncbi:MULTISPECIES: hypothetical protein [unclassified Paenibacillus]|uniref:Uncharacterized protein n=1 Tax=Paenibacillus provencensis TaxID=441151 RepID=A0ABW3Q745_9BACL|nr:MULTISPECIES: hypothetical protein [unclassified Paenibacillus]MCM3130169.1 hypothetical protein [Paenibacillus sp. MER 78]SDX70977.1 hypothetical protein SAMN05518848_11260 [Paenibacillus sp. PDC88]SFS88404.1 hypothetical protein SAMN04488601_10656 [Paenibacillus sp. 453mf]